MKLVVLGAPRPLHLNRWKDDLAEAGAELGWHVTHLPARGVEAADVVRHARGADLLIWARTHGHRPSGDVSGMLRRIEDRGTVTVALHLDLYWGVGGNRQRDIGRSAWWTCQYVYTADGGKRPWAQRGVEHRWLPPPMGSRFLGRGPVDRRYKHAAIFVGSLGAVHGRHRREMVSWARRKFGWTGFRQYGTSYAGSGGLWGADLNRLYASARVVLGDSAPAPCYWSDRVPTTLGRGGLLAHPRTAGFAEQGFTDDVMVLFDRFDFDGLGAKLDAVTSRRRREMTDAAIQLISERHLWRHRLQDIAREVVYA